MLSETEMYNLNGSDGLAARWLRPDVRHAALSAFTIE